MVVEEDTVGKSSSKGKGRIGKEVDAPGSVEAVEVESVKTSSMGRVGE